MLKEFCSVESSHQNKDAKDFNNDTQYKEFLNEVSFYPVYHYQYQVDNFLFSQLLEAKSKILLKQSVLMKLKYAVFVELLLNNAQRMLVPYMQFRCISGTLAWISVSCCAAAHRRIVNFASVSLVPTTNGNYTQARQRPSIPNACLFPSTSPPRRQSESPLHAFQICLGLLWAGGYYFRESAPARI